MSRRKIGGRSYKYYSDRQMELCLSDTENKVLTQREASEKYKIPRSSIILKIKAIRSNLVRPPGRQCVFTAETTSYSKGNKIQKKKKKQKKKRDSENESESEEDQVVVETVNDSDSEGPFIEEEEEECEEENLEPKNVSLHYFPEDYVVVEYEGELWPGQIQSIEEEGAYVKCMACSGLSWKWPEKEDNIFYPLDDIKYKIEEPKKMSTKRSLFRVPELESRWGNPKK